MESGRVRRTLAVCGLLLSLVAQLAPAITARAVSSQQTPVPAANFAGIELFFESTENLGSGPSQFLARGRNYQFLLGATNVQFALLTAVSHEDAPSEGRHQIKANPSISVVRAGVHFARANPLAQIQGDRPTSVRVNYLVGDDPSRWRSDMAAFSSVKVEALYPGVDLIYYGHQQQLEYDFVVGPKVDPQVIAMQFTGVDKILIDEQGQLILKLAGGEIRQPAPVIYQIQGMSRLPVEGGYHLASDGTVTFAVGKYNPELPLVIDPRFDYSTYFGGNAGDLALAIKVDTNGNVFVTGQTFSTKFPFATGTGGVQSHFGGGNGDAFVAKLDNTGTNLVYFTYLGGSGDDSGLDIAIDSRGNAYIAGRTQSPNFPTRNALFPHISGTPDPTLLIYPTDGFVAELNTNGSGLVFSTYLGGNNGDIADGIDVDPAGAIYVTGLTSSPNFPMRNPLPGHSSIAGGKHHAFVTKFVPGGTSLVFSTYLNGKAVDEGQGIAADAAGFAYVTGFTASTNFPITADAPYRRLNGTNGRSGSFDAFVSKFDPAGALVFSTYLGGSYNDYGYRIKTDITGNYYVTGPSQSTNFPVTKTVPGLGQFPYSTNRVVNYDVFLTKFNPSNQPVYSILFGGTKDDIGWDLAVDALGNAFVVGGTASTNFPTTNVFDLFRATHSGAHEVFVAAVNSNATAALYSGYLGGTNNDSGYGIAVDSESSAYIVGNTYSRNFPTRSAFQPARSASSDCFIAKIRINDPLLVTTLSGDELQMQWPATAPGYLLESAAGLIPPLTWKPVVGAPVLTPGWYSFTVGLTNADSLFRLRSP
ncbi:MAG TPA: SBBP repeat-containing protein [Candidatus Limnocylindrales bacterium]|nr:SBBP repeat-containing protein [Candidatus Limnocylindrales bacterium]